MGWALWEIKNIKRYFVYQSMFWSFFKRLNKFVRSMMNRNINNLLNKKKRANDTVTSTCLSELQIHQILICRSSHRGFSVKKGVRNFAKFTGKHLYQSPFFNKVTGLRPATLLKKRLWHRCFLVNFAKFIRTPFSQNNSGRLLLDIGSSLINLFIWI